GILRQRRHDKARCLRKGAVVKRHTLGHRYRHQQWSTRSSSTVSERKKIYPVTAALEERKGQVIAYMVWCPGCECGHQFYVLPPHKKIVNGKWTGEWEGPVWTFDGNMECPTFTPSMLVTGSEMTAAGRADYDAWSAAGHPPRNGKPFESAPMRC